MDRNEFKKLFFCAQGYFLTPYLLWSSYNYIPSGMATTIHFVYPVLVLIGSIVFYHEKLTGKKAVSCPFCVMGILCLCQTDGTISLMGFLIAFVSGIGTAELFLIALWTGKFTLSVAPAGWVLTVIFALSAGVIASTAFQLGTKYIGAQNASVLSTFEPLTSVIVGVIVYHEVMTGRTIAGITAILLSVIVVSCPDRTKK